MNMKTLLIALLVICSVQLAGAQDWLKPYDLKETITEVKAKRTTYWVKEIMDHKSVWRTDFVFKNVDTNIRDVAQLPRLILINEDKFDSYIEKVMPKQDRADEITDNVFRLYIYADPTTGEIKYTQFTFDDKLVMPIKTIEKIDEYLKKNCRLEFEHTKVTRKANYIPYDYCYLYSEHTFKE